MFRSQIHIKPSLNRALEKLCEADRHFCKMFLQLEGWSLFPLCHKCRYLIQVTGLNVILLGLETHNCRMCGLKSVYAKQPKDELSVFRMPYKLFCLKNRQIKENIKKIVHNITTELPHSNTHTDTQTQHKAPEIGELVARPEIPL